MRKKMLCFIMAILVTATLVGCKTQIKTDEGQEPGCQKPAAVSTAEAAQLLENKQR